MEYGFQFHNGFQLEKCWFDSKAERDAAFKEPRFGMTQRSCKIWRKARDIA